MSIGSEVSAIEAGLRNAQIPLADLLTKAEIDRSTWTRWRSGAVAGPRMTTWDAVQRAAADLLKAGGRTTTAAPARRRRGQSTHTGPRR